jgi:hypothetical protein
MRALLAISIFVFLLFSPLWVSFLRRYFEYRRECPRASRRDAIAWAWNMAGC